MKSPEDFSILHQLLWHVKPLTVIELGTYTGGMAVWIADTLKLLDVPSQIYSVDVDLSLREDRVNKLKPDNVTFLQGDCNAIEKTFTPDFMSQLLHPWVVIDDSTYEATEKILEHFHMFLQQGDYLVVEDTNPHIPRDVGMGQFSDEPFYEHGTDKLEKLKKFLKKNEDYYAVDSFYTDLYGYNGTWHWNGYIKQIK